ncbi:MAG: hypothetical protein ACLTYN_09945 [Dysosmobacter welbionis]
MGRRYVGISGGGFWDDLPCLLVTILGFAILILGCRYDQRTSLRKIE